MSFYELYGLTRGKNKSARQGAATCSAEPRSQPDSDFVEIAWENGQVVMQGQSNKTRKPTSDNISTEGLPQNTRLRNKGLVKNDDTEMGLGRLGMMESAMNDFHIPAPTELDEHDEMVPWLRYHMSDDGPVQHNYGYDFYPELSGVTAHNLLSHGSNVTAAGRRCAGARAINGLHPVPVQNAIDFEHRNGIPLRPEGSQSDQLSMHQSICSFPSYRSKALDIDSNCLHNSNQQLLLGDSAKKDSVYPRMKMQTQDPAQQLPSSTIMNFSYFSKHAMVKSSPNSISSKAAPEVSTKEMDGMEIGSVPKASKQADPLQVASITGPQRNSRYHTQIGALSTLDVSKMTTSKPLCANHSGLISCQDSRKIDMPPKKLGFDGNTVTGNIEKTVEPPNVASSVCSGNSVDRASNDPTCGLKRKYSEFEDSEYHSEDTEEDSVGIRKAAANRVGSGSKRRRAAEVHNLSERRRRDRINEKMRALQEIIPNCNKVDKASMLDEAIEYLKTLQLQVQMMSVGPGFCMPQMMLPHAAHIPRFSSMSVGMGMGYGLGMLDMNGNPSNYQLVQMASVPGTRFPMAPAAGFCNLNATSLPNHPVYGFQGQCIGTPVTCPPAISYTADPPIRPVMDLNTLSSALPVGDLGSGQTSQIISKNPPKLITTSIKGGLLVRWKWRASFPVPKAIESSTEVDILLARETYNNFFR